MKTEKTKIFICYPEEDVEQVKDLREKLLTYECECFVATTSIQAGDPYKKEIKKALEACTIFLLLANENSEKSAWCNQEIGMAIAQKKTIVKILKKGSSMWGFDQTQAIVYENCLLDEPFFTDLITEIEKQGKNSYLGLKSAALKTLKKELGVEGIQVQHGDSTQKANYCHFITDTFNDHGFQTSCYLYSGDKQIAGISLAHRDFYDTRTTSPYAQKGHGDKMRIVNFLKCKEITFLDDVFFSRCTVKKDVSEDLSRAIKCLFNDITSYPHIFEKYKDKTVTELSLFRDDEKNFESLCNSMAAETL